MHILHLTDAYSHGEGSIGHAIDTCRRGLDLQGIRSTLVAPDSGSSPVNPDRIAIPARLLPGGGELRLLNWSALSAGVALALRGGVDAIHVHSPLLAHAAGARLAARHGVPLLVSWHGPVEALLPGLDRYLPGAAARRLGRQLTLARCRAAHCVVAASERIGSRLVSYGVRGRIEVVPEGIDPAHFAAGDGRAFRARHALDADRALALLTGPRGAQAHGDDAQWPFLLDTIEQLRAQSPRLQILLAGEMEGADRVRYRVRAAGLASHVRVVGLDSRPRALADCYAACDLMALASRDDADADAVLRAMAAGLPVVAIAHQGAPDVLRRARGVRLTPDTAPALAQVVGRLAANPRQLALLSREARAECRHWSQATMAERLADIYASLRPQATRRDLPPVSRIHAARVKTG
ncbi:MAG: glycosyltransferase family 4 protein [Rhodocyclaceae bacterium]|nr:glycosyltransferase family 4 protein [Rhodocyclaceae bacterium]